MEHPKDATAKKHVAMSDGGSAVSFYKNFIAGGIAGAVSRTVVSPLERAKILFQVQNSASVTGMNQKGFDSLHGTFRTILKQDGIQGLFKGNGTNILRIVPYSSMQFASYELYLKVPNVVLMSSQAGACAGITAATFTYPLDLIRTRLSLVTDSKFGILRGLIDVYKNEGGITALYRGLLPTLMGIAPLVAINFTVYERLKNHARLISGQLDVPVGTRLACGGVAGAVAQTVTYPLDVLRRRLQSSVLLGFNYDGVMDAARRMYTDEGLRSFYRGLLPNYLKMVPAISVSFVVYETMQSILE